MASVLDAPANIVTPNPNPSPRPIPVPIPDHIPIIRIPIPIPVAIPNRVAGLCALPLTIHPARSLARRRIHSFCHGCTLSPEVAHNRTAHSHTCTLAHHCAQYQY